MLRPCGHRILVAPENIDEMQGSLFLPPETRQNMGDAQIFGNVVKIGATAFKDFGGEAWCKEGDRVAFAKYGGFIIQDPESKKEFRLLNDEDIVAIVS